jgi:hypothetical protein
MRKRAVIALLFACCAWLVWNSLSPFATPLRVPGARTASANDTLRDRLIVHEWGTFTSYSGSDGVRLEFRPLAENDLPPFVLDRARQSGNIFNKRQIRAQVRMETPVTYFYTEQPREVRVRVGFPQGLLTEFYPPVAAFAPPDTSKPVLANSMLDWGTVTLIPQELFRPKLADEELARVIGERAAQGLTPRSEGNPYQFARETDSAIVHVRRQQDPQQLFTPQGDFFEKFLFYRGLGNFALPLQARALGSGQLQVVNRGTDDISWFLAFEVRGDQLRFATGDGVRAGMMRGVSLPETAGDQQQMIQQLVAALVHEGLYQREAEAMVKTWQASWFGEQGTRVLYLVPERITDEMLPLDIEPRPEEMVRVLVGRLDIMSPEEESQMTELVRRSAAARSQRIEVAKQNNTEVVYPLPDEIAQLGRLAEPALARVRDLSNDPTISFEAGLLLQTLSEMQETALANSP